MPRLTWKKMLGGWYRWEPQSCTCGTNRGAPTPGKLHCMYCLGWDGTFAGPYEKPRA